MHLGQARVGELTFRRATADDVATIVAMLADDALGAKRESLDDPAPYQDAFRAIDGDARQYLAVAERDGENVGTLQLTFIPGLSLKGAIRAQIEGVRVASAARGTGLGSQLIEWAVEEARARGCRMVQLTTNNARTDAHRFYEKLGFEPTHIGFKRML
jgi:GNAT superfamily N-acetyltransferase